MRKILALSLLLLSLSAANSHAMSPGGKKILIGCVMAGAGVALAANSFDRCIFKECSDGDLEMVAGLALLGSGVTLTVWGIVQKAHGPHTEKYGSTDHHPALQFGFTPVRSGIAAGAILRW